MHRKEGSMQQPGMALKQQAEQIQVTRWEEKLG